MKTCIGLDIGRSAVKAVAWSGAGKVDLCFASSVAPAFRISDEDEARRSAGETVSVDGRNWFFGETAKLQGGDDLNGGLHDDWVFQDRYAVLYLGALRKLWQLGVPNVESALIVLGLPASLYASQKEALATHIRKYSPNAEIRVNSQPIGPYYQMLFMSDGRENSSFSADEASWAVIEIGQYTTDYALLLDGRVIENGFGSCAGMSVAATNLQRIMQDKKVSLSLSDATRVLETKSVKQFGKWLELAVEVDTAVAPVAATILDTANKLIGRHAKSLDGILVAGGGAPLVMPALRRNWPHVRESENPRFAVADGFHRFARGLQRYRQAQSQAAA